MNNKYEIGEEVIICKKNSYLADIYKGLSGKVTSIHPSAAKFDNGYWYKLDIPGLEMLRIPENWLDKER